MSHIHIWYESLFLVILILSWTFLWSQSLTNQSTADMAEEEEERRILVAVDEGEESMYALSWCLKNLAFQNSKDTLLLLYVKPPRVTYSAFDGTGMHHYRTEKKHISLAR